MANARFTSKGPEAYLGGYDGQFRHTVEDATAAMAVFVGLFLSFFVFAFFFSIAPCAIFSKKTRAQTSHSDLASYLVIAFAATFACGLVGVYGWIYDAPLIQDRLYEETQSGSARFMSIVMFAYQIWNFWMCYRIKDYCSPETLGHHVVTATLASFCFFPFVHYYALFFIGIAELTNIPLTIYDGLKYMQAKDQFPNLYNYSKIAFAVSFLVVRCVWWPIVSFDFWVEMFTAMRTGQVHGYFVFYFFLFGNFSLTCLQFFWASKIVRMAFSAPRAKKEKKESKKE